MVRILPNKLLRDAVRAAAVAANSGPGDDNACESSAAQATTTILAPPLGASGAPNKNDVEQLKDDTTPKIVQTNSSVHDDVQRKSTFHMSEEFARMQEEYRKRPKLS